MAALVDTAIGGDPGMLENLFQQIIADLKASFPIWEDFTSKASKLHTVLRSAVCAISAFLESMQRVADMALGTRGATSDLGSALTRLCLRQRGLEDKLKAFVGSIVECLVNPLQSRMDEWRKMVNLLDKDHTKESKRVHQDMKKAFAETVALKKKAKKGKPGASAQVEQAVADYKEKYEMLEALERNAVKTALIEERSRFCHFVNCLNPVMDCQVAMLSEITHISEIVGYLRVQSVQPCFVPNQNYAVQEWRKATTPDYILLSSPGSPSVSQESSKSSGSSEGCCNSPPVSSTSPQLIHQQSCTATTATSIRQQSDDGSDGTTRPEEEPHRIQYVRCPSSWPGSPVEQQPTSQTFPGAAKSGLSKVAQQQQHQRSAEHCAKCCQHCQVVVLPQGPLSSYPVYSYAVPTVGSHREPPSTLAATGEADPKESPTETETTPDGVPPVGGYVNMNQLASLAVQQNELSLKTKASKNKNETASNGNKNDEATANNKQDTNEVQTSSDVTHEISEWNRGRSRTAEDIITNGGAPYSPRIGGANGLPGAKVRDLSLPPTFRKPLRTSSSPSQSSSPQQQVYSSVNRGRSERQGRVAVPERKQSRVQRIPSSESPPPPPLPEDYPTSSELVLESDYLPLPPPPAYQGSSAEGTQCWAQPLKCPVIPEIGFPSSIHPAPAVEGDYTSLPEAYRVKLGLVSPAAGRDVTLEEKDMGADGSNTFADSIRRGVALRKTLTNDRSAPRVPTNP